MFRHIRGRSRRRVALVAVALSLTAALAVSGAALMKWRAHRRYLWVRAAGTQALASENYESSRRYFEEYLRYRPDDTAAQYRYALAVYRADGPGRAYEVDVVAALCRVIEMQPTHLGANQLLLIHYRRLGMTEEALAVANRLLARQPDHVPTLYARLSLLEESGRLDEALADAQRVAELKSNEGGAQETALRLAARVGRPAAARAIFAPEDPRQMALEATAQHYAGNLPAAKRIILAAVDAAPPQDSSALLFLVRRLDVAGCADRADQLLDDALSRLSDARIYRAWLRRQVERGRYQAVIDRVGTADSARHVRDSDTLPWLAWSLRETGRGNEAQACVKALLARRSDAQAQVWVTLLSARVGTLPSLEDLEDAVAVDPDQAIFHVLLGDRWLRLGESAVAATCYEKASMCSPGWELPRRRLAELPADRFTAIASQDAEALHEATGGRGVRWRVAMADQLMRAGADVASLAKAAELLHDTIRRCPREPLPHDLLARCLRLIGSNEQAAARQRLADSLRRS